MSPHSVDEQHLHRALELARAGIGLASPNPYVGVVIADSRGDVVGTGTYTYAGVKHAEILALEAAGSKARGGTLYINLEPHAHQGRTGPCTDALIAAGIGRVVAAMADPNPKVSGRGFEQLRAAGIQVEVGGMEVEARRLNEAFARYIRHGVPLVTLKSAMTLDGKIAPAAVTRKRGNGSSGKEFSGAWITGELARAHVHEMRHQQDAIVAGVGTIIADNPLLSDRSGGARRRRLLRVILDSRLRLPLDSRLVESVARERDSGEEGDVVVFCSAASEQKKSQLEKIGIRVEAVAAVEPDKRPDLRAVLRRLGELETTSVMIEGGSTVNAAALAANVVDKVFLYYAPKILGEEAIPFAAGAGLGEGAQVKDVRVQRFGEDFAVEGYLRDPYGE
jgi:diaminohydroxyphosphoribosylaminopyrimidine deaminase/5-amino-6-(5-phosphoribosylamino)uracil reductase